MIVTQAGGVTGNYGYLLGCYYGSVTSAAYLYCELDQTTGNLDRPDGRDAAGQLWAFASKASACGDHLAIAMDSHCLGEAPATGPQCKRIEESCSIK